MNALNFLASARVARGPGARVARAHLARVCFDDALRCIGLFMLLSVFGVVLFYPSMHLTERECL